MPLMALADWGKREPTEEQISTQTFRCLFTDLEVLIKHYQVCLIVL